MRINPTSAFEKISNEYYQLTTAERKVADYVVIHQLDTQFMSISELAEACGVAEATVSRFCRSLNYKGYNAFKLAVANSAVQRTADAYMIGSVSPEDSIPDICQKLYSSSADAMAQTMALVRPENIRLAADILAQSKKVLCMGQGGSMIIAMEAAHLFSTAMSGFIPVYDSHLQIIAAATLTPEDAVFFFSYSGATQELLDLLAVVKEQGAKVILMTHFPKSPAAAFADVILQCGANEGPLQLGSVAARVAQLYLLDVLLNELCRRDEEVSTETRTRVAAALAVKHI